MKPLTLIPILAAASVLLAGCGAGDDDGGSAQPGAAPAAGSVLTIDEALAAQSDEPLTVRGFLFVQGGRVRLCDGFAESYPPQCVQPWIDVIGYKLLEQRQLYKMHAGVSWTEKPVELLGTIQNGSLTVSKNAGA